MSPNDPTIPTQKPSLGARFRKFISIQDKSVEPKSFKAKHGDSKDTSSKSTLLTSSSDATSKSPVVENSIAISNVSPRLAAEVEFRSAMIQLNEAVVDRYQVPQAFALQTVDHVNDVEATCLKLETAIDTIIDQRTNACKVDKQIWKDCVKRWYDAIFPYVKPCLHTVAVSLL
jgi:hypothetical protein